MPEERSGLGKVPIIGNFWEIYKREYWDPLVKGGVHPPILTEGRTWSGKQPEVQQSRQQAANEEQLSRKATEQARHVQSPGGQQEIKGKKIQDAILRERYFNEAIDRIRKGDIPAEGHGERSRLLKDLYTYLSQEALQNKEEWQRRADIPDMDPLLKEQFSRYAQEYGEVSQLLKGDPGTLPDRLREYYTDEQKAETLSTRVQYLNNALDSWRGSVLESPQNRIANPYTLLFADQLMQRDVRDKGFRDMPYWGGGAPGTPGNSYPIDPSFVRNMMLRIPSAIPREAPLKTQGREQSMLGNPMFQPVSPTVMQSPTTVVQGGGGGFGLGDLLGMGLGLGMGFGTGNWAPLMGWGMNQVGMSGAVPGGQQPQRRPSPGIQQPQQSGAGQDDKTRNNLDRNARQEMEAGSMVPGMGEVMQPPAGGAMMYVPPPFMGPVAYVPQGGFAAPYTNPYAWGFGV